ncbi:tRNA-dihydrouridine synthase [Candidatus Kaiserbacteria bacterium CG10_big_fil_rev_8_21_14_0_10_51_14]|uniref:tRNA-dihydrouridine synthase n=1 Tax=Candidatus Kaiserbacteria bacterium CG10_big_fil_rev_8_21_14_0_10_51_14 TaxID=1974610 RepID=A0A2H0UD04_9BACT|nr:MAG: tRNA-dihydrouridine synthase [Candidatus Kaiserbacteria bacterium CG10_big_fil_rev_8_21_14_0_10_51_14]
MENFWEKLPRPFFALAPLEDVTDAAFRRLIARYGKPAVMFTEFTSADGLVLAPPEGQRMLRKKLIYGEDERPIVAQLFTANPEHMEKIAYMIAELGFDGFDINMGCPVDEVVRQGCGAALIKNPVLARELIRAAKRSGLPVSLKTRIGYNTDELDSWLPELLAEEPVAITIHARTRKEMSDVPARWDTVARAVQIRNAIQNPRGDTSWIKTLIIGNGDVKDIADARAKAAETKCDGVMLGRAIYGNPWLFNDLRNRYNGFVNRYMPTSEERLQALSEHLAFFDELLGDTTNYATMKKHFKAYISGWDGAKELRMRMMETENVVEAQAILASAILPE